MIKMSTLTDFHGLPDTLCDIILSFGSVAWKSRQVGQFFYSLLYVSIFVNPIDEFMCQQP